MHAPPGNRSRLGCNPSSVTLMQQALGVSLAAERSAAARAIGSADPDLSLIEGIAAGRREALGLLYQRHAAALFRFIVQRLAGDAPLAEEVLQDVMLAVWQGAAGFRGDSRLLTWLFGIAHRQALQARRKRAGQLRRELAADLPQGAADGQFQAAELRADTTALRAAVAELPDDMRAALQLTLVEGLSCSEAAEVLGVATGTVKSRLFRGRSLLREALAGLAGEEHP